MIKVLHVCAAMNDGEVERFILNYYSAIDREQIQFDFAVYSKNEGMLEPVAKELGANIFHIPPKSQNVFAYVRGMKAILKEGNYDIIHCHQGYKSIYPFIIAKWCKVPILIAHAHTMGEPLKPCQKLFKRLEVNQTCKYATALFSCSEAAGIDMWGNRAFTVIPDAIDLNRFKFSEESRNRIRKELGVEQNWLIGCVGRMVASKNHKRLFQIIRLLQEKCPATALLLLGTGPLEEELKQFAKDNKLEKVFFLGNKENVEEYLCACDEFVLPTLYEGFGMALLEAQENGLETFTSDVVPDNVKVSNKIYVASLDSTDEEWVNMIMEEMDRTREELLASNNRQ